MLHDQLCQECAVHAAGHIVASRNGKKSPRVIIESYRIVEPCGLGNLLAETHHSFWTVVKPPWRPQTQAWIMPSQRRQFAAIGRFIQSKENDRKAGLIAKPVEQRAKGVHIIRWHGNVGAHVAAVFLVELAIVIARAAGMNLHD